MESNSKPQKSVRDRFKQGCEFVFKKWTAFRLALDNNPRILTYYNEDQSVLEINEMLATLFEEIFMTLNSGSFAGQMLANELADILNGFMSDYFNISLEDDSDLEVANILIKLYDELKKGKDNLFNSLESYKNTSTQYRIEYPILGNQKVIFEKSNDEESEEEDMEDDENKDVEMKDSNNNDEDDDGFVEVKKKGKGY